MLLSIIGRRKVTALIYAHGRSGSSEFLCCIADAKGLKTYKNLAWEPFKQKNFKKYGYHHDRIRSRKSLKEYINHLSSLSLVKHIWTQVRNDFNQEILSNETFDRCIFLYRRSLFDVVISLLVASATQEWRYVTTNKTVGEISFTDFQNTLNTLKYDQQAYAEYFSSVMQKKRGAYVINYESLYGMTTESRMNQVNIVTHVFETLGFKTETLNIPLLIDKWLKPDNKYKTYKYYKHVVSNFDALYEEFGWANQYYLNHPDKTPESIVSKLGSYE